MVKASIFGFGRCTCSLFVQNQVQHTTRRLLLAPYCVAAGVSSIKSEWQIERRQIKTISGLSCGLGREGSYAASGIVRVTVLRVCSSQSRGVRWSRAWCDAGEKLNKERPWWDGPGELSGVGPAAFS